MTFDQLERLIFRFSFHFQQNCELKTQIATGTYLLNRHILYEDILLLKVVILTVKRSFIEYNRSDAVAYALKWAMGRNPQFYDYSSIGGDCTNFASQVLWAGGSLMNYDPFQGWYYIDANRKSPSWTGADFLGNFLIANRGQGPVGELVTPEKLQAGDLIQLSFQGGGKFQHSLIVTKLEFPVTLEHIYISTHTGDQLNRKLTQYLWREIRYIHIVAANTI